MRKSYGVVCAMAWLLALALMSLMLTGCEAIRQAGESAQAAAESGGGLQSIVTAGIIGLIAGAAGENRRQNSKNGGKKR